MEAIWKKEYSLNAITAPDQFKTYEELERRMNMVLGLSPSSSPTQSRAVVEQEDRYESYNQPVNSETKVLEELEQSYARSKSPTLPTVTAAVDEDEDDALAYFSRLAND